MVRSRLGGLAWICAGTASLHALLLDASHASRDNKHDTLGKNRLRNHMLINFGFCEEPGSFVSSQRFTLSRWLFLHPYFMKIWNHNIYDLANHAHNKHIVLLICSFAVLASPVSFVVVVAVVVCMCVLLLLLYLFSFCYRKKESIINVWYRPMHIIATEEYF